MSKKIICVFILIQFSSLSIFCNATIITNGDPEAPDTPTITGPKNGEIDQNYYYNITTTDPQNDNIHFLVICSDSPAAVFKSKWLKSGETLNYNHCWCCDYQKSNPFKIYAKAIDVKGYESEWGEFIVNITNIKEKNFPFIIIKQIFKTLMDRIPIFEKILNQIII